MVWWKHLHQPFKGMSCKTPWEKVSSGKADHQLVFSDLSWHSNCHIILHSHSTSNTTANLTAFRVQRFSSSLFAHRFLREKYSDSKHLHLKLLAASTAKQFFPCEIKNTLCCLALTKTTWYVHVFIMFTNPSLHLLPCHSSSYISTLAAPWLGSSTEDSLTEQSLQPPGCFTSFYCVSEKLESIP